MASKRLEETFEKNLQLLPQPLKERVRKLTREEIWDKVEIHNSTAGNPICTYRDHQQRFQITSTRPIREAEEWCKHLALEDTGALFVYGCGFGYVLFELLKQKQPNTIILVYERSIELFAAMMHYFDLEPLFKSQKFSFFVGSIEEFSSEFHQVFFSEVFLYTTAPSVAFTPTAQRNFKKEYLRIHAYIFKELSLNVFYMGNDHYDTLLGFHNLIANIHEVVENPYLDTLKDKYRGFPAFIISNGPSLDKNIQELKKIDRKGLILSTESAIIPLIKNGIKPDILSIIERTKYTYLYHFEGREYPDDIALLALALIDRHVYPYFKGPRIPIFRSTESINRWMNQIIADKRSSLDAGANVSHLAFEIAVYLGANPIIFVGQDFAFGPGGMTHSKDASYHEEKGKEAVAKLRTKPVVYVEGNDGTQIPSTQLWTDFKQGLERKIANYPHLTVINATEGGAKINGTTCMSLKDAINHYCVQDIPYRVDSLIKEEKTRIQSSERYIKLQRFIGELHRYVEAYRKLCQLSIKARLRSKEMIERCNHQEDMEDSLEILEQAYEQNFYDLKMFMSDNLYFVFLQQVLMVGFHKMNRLGAIHSIERIKQVFEIHDELFQHLNIICQSVVVNFEIAMEKVYAHLQKKGYK